MEKLKVSAIRGQFPGYQDLSDDQLISAIRAKFYPDVPIGKFAKIIDYDTQRQALQSEITDGMSGVDTLRAGWGKALSDIATGVRQKLPGGASGADVDQTQREDAGLMRTTGGKVGHFGGSVSAAIPTFALPGGATLAGAAVTGGALGYLQPTGSEDNSLVNAAIGTGAGAGGVMAGRALAGGYQAVKAMAAPFSQAGREKIAGRMLERFAENPNSIKTAPTGPTPTGAMPTLAESTGDAGIARLQDALRSVDPQVANMIGARLADNNAARVGALTSLAGDSAKRKTAIAAREAAASPAYQQAYAKTVPVDAELKAILERPSVQAALGRAANFAKEEGRTFGLKQGTQPTQSAILGSNGAPIAATPGKPASIDGRTLQDLKMGMDALLKDPASGIAGAESGAVRETRAALLKWMEQRIPEFNAARTTYAKASKPINAMDVGEELARRATSNLSDLAGNQRLQANALMGVLRDEPALIQRATGRKGINALSDVFDSNQLATVRGVASEADRAAAVQAAGNGPGSATAQRMASQNILRQLVGPTGLPASWAESVAANTVVGKPLNLVYGGVAEPKIQQALAEAVLDPVKARAFLEAAQKQGWRLPDNAATRALMQSARVSTPVFALPEPGGR